MNIEEMTAKELMAMWLRFQAKAMLADCSLGGDCCHAKCIFAREYLGMPAESDQHYSHPWNEVKTDE
jgi:hypothetical protein